MILDLAEGEGRWRELSLAFSPCFLLSEKVFSSDLAAGKVEGGGEIVHQNIYLSAYTSRDKIGLLPEKEREEVM